MKELTVPAKIENLSQVLTFVEDLLSETDCPMGALVHLQIAVEEIFVNIAHYAYPSGTGEATIRCDISPATPPVTTIEFRDWGIAYNPLAREDPDITLSAEDREIGGLGIYMVKKSMDALHYEYLDGQNILTIKKVMAADPIQA